MAEATLPQTEMTPEGEQALVEGVQPLIRRDRLQFNAGLPLQAKQPQRPCDLGLFDLDARRQIDWLDELRKPDPFAGQAIKPAPSEPPARCTERGLHPS